MRWRFRRIQFQAVGCQPGLNEKHPLGANALGPLQASIAECQHLFRGEIRAFENFSQRIPLQCWQGRHGGTALIEMIQARRWQVVTDGLAERLISTCHAKQQAWSALNDYQTDRLANSARDQEQRIFYKDMPGLQGGTTRTSAVFAYAKIIVRHRPPLRQIPVHLVFPLITDDMHQEIS